MSTTRPGQPQQNVGDLHRQLNDVKSRLTATEKDRDEQKDGRQKATVDVIDLADKLDIAEAKIKMLEAEKLAADSATDEAEPSLKESIFGNRTPFKVLVLNLIVATVENRVTPNQAVHFMHDWFNQLNVEQRKAFYADRNSSEETINYFKNVVENLSQQLPVLLSQ